MGNNFELPPISRKEELRLLGLLGFPDFDVEVTRSNPYGEYELKAKLIRDHGDAYHARPELSHSQFVKFRREPEVFEAEVLDGKPQEEKEHFEFGKQVEHFLFHDELPGHPIEIVPDYVLSRRKKSSTWFAKHQVEYDADNEDHHTYAKAGKEYHDFCKLHRGKTIMTQKEYDELVEPLEKIRNNVREHSKAKALLYGDSLRHIAILFTCPFSGITLRCQLDNVSRQKSINDFKTAVHNTEWTFAADFYKWQYHIQAAFYREAVRQLTGEQWPVNYIVSEKSSGCYVVEVYNISEGWFDIALDEWRQAMQFFRQCVESESWKRESHNTVVELRPPPYVVRKHRRYY